MEAIVGAFGGLTAGWLIQWLIDLFYWRNKRICSEGESKLRDALAEMTSERDGLRRQAEDLAARAKRIPELEAELDKERAQLGTIRDQFRAQEVQLNDLQRETANLRPMGDERAALQSTLDGVNARIPELETELGKEREQLGTLRDQLRQQEVQLNEAQREAAGLRPLTGERDALRADLDRANERIEELERDVEERQQADLEQRASEPSPAVHMSADLAPADPQSREPQSSDQRPDDQQDEDDDLENRLLRIDLHLEGLLKDMVGRNMAIAKNLRVGELYVQRGGRMERLQDDEAGTAEDGTASDEAREDAPSGVSSRTTALRSQLYRVEHQADGDGRWREGGSWVMGTRSGERLTALSGSSDDGGFTLEGLWSYGSDDLTAFRATMTAHNTYEVEAQIGGEDGPWQPAGTWLLGARVEHHVVALDLTSEDGGETLAGTCRYEDEPQFTVRCQTADGGVYAVTSDDNETPTCWVIGRDRPLQSLVCRSDDDGLSLLGSCDIGGTVLGFRAVRWAGNAYHTEVRSASGGGWTDSGMWVLGSRKDVNLVSVHLEGRGTLTGPCAYAGERPQRVTCRAPEVELVERTTAPPAHAGSAGEAVGPQAANGATTETSPDPS
ncbi:hypothetical protein [Rubrivirga sp. IMCC45206]|uniref:hypothetical protein n=1 Tax=Rubrivirga sp. IMCC45206 TaxID=3391614 RepID=UPI00398FAC33